MKMDIQKKKWKVIRQNMHMYPSACLNMHMYVPFHVHVHVTLGISKTSYSLNMHIFLKIKFKLWKGAFFHRKITFSPRNTLWLSFYRSLF